MASSAVIGREIRAALSKVIGEAMIRACDAVAAATPVDTHHAETNWVLSVGAPYTLEDGTRQNVSDAAQQAGYEAMRNYDLGRDGAAYLRNNVAYVKYLDEGWSSQAPAGYVGEAIESAVAGTPYGRRGSVRKMLRAMSRASIVRRGSRVRNAAIARNR